LTATSLGNATGTLGVDVLVGGGVFEGKGVCVGRAVAGGGVFEGVIGAAVVVSVGRLDGRLQPTSVKVRTSTDKAFRDFIEVLLCVVTVDDKVTVTFPALPWGACRPSDCHLMF
jgi:hypothetical protein